MAEAVPPDELASFPLVGADMNSRERDREAWPDLPYWVWEDTCATLQLWTQIVGKIRLSQTPWLNHSWHVALYMTARGLTTSPIPFGERVFQIDFDFIDHLLRIETSDGRQRQIPLRAQSVADFYVAVVAALADLRIKVRIGERPNEVPDPIRFSEDKTHAAYDPEYARRFWRILLQVDRLAAALCGEPKPSHRVSHSASWTARRA